MPSNTNVYTPSLNLSGRLVFLDRPLIMGILNVTHDSFYAASRANTDEAIAQRARQLIADGAHIIDVGACSTRPGSTPVDAEVEWQRLNQAFATLRRELPDAILSVDTFRADIAQRCVQEYGVNIVNDISGGTLDEQMFTTVARLSVPYVLTHIKGTPFGPQPTPHYDNVTVEVTQWLAERADQLHQLGLADVIVDPGFGFGKTVQQNHELLNNLDHLRRELHEPILVGISRKSMVCQPLGITPDEALQPTIALQQLAISKGANILRTHDPAHVTLP